MLQHLHFLQPRRNFQSIPLRMSQHKQPIRRHHRRQIWMIQQLLRKRFRPLPHIFLPIRRICHHQIKQLPPLRQRIQNLQRIIHNNLKSPRLHTRRFHVIANMPRMLRRQLHTNRPRRPATQRLQTQSPAPAKQLQHPRPNHPFPQRIKNRLLHQIRRRPHIQPLGNLQNPPTRLPSNHSHPQMLNSPADVIKPPQL